MIRRPGERKLSFYGAGDERSAADREHEAWRVQQPEPPVGSRWDIGPGPLATVEAAPGGQWRLRYDNGKVSNPMTGGAAKFWREVKP